jgi:hypothetical protein
VAIDLRYYPRQFRQPLYFSFQNPYAKYMRVPLVFEKSLTSTAGLSLSNLHF